MNFLYTSKDYFVMSSMSVEPCTILYKIRFMQELDVRKKKSRSDIGVECWPILLRIEKRISEIES
jgi:hypothetical protein